MTAMDKLPEAGNIYCVQYSVGIMYLFFGCTCFLDFFEDVGLLNIKRKLIQK